MNRGEVTCIIVVYDLLRFLDSLMHLTISWYCCAPWHNASEIHEVLTDRITSTTGIESPKLPTS